MTKIPKHIELFKQVSGAYEIKGTNMMVPAFDLFDFVNDMLNDDHTITVYPVRLARNYTRYKKVSPTRRPKARSASGGGAASGSRRTSKKAQSKKRQPAV